jgi:microcystin degradation protein MlrC
VVVVGGNIHVLVMSTATYDWADEQYLTMGLDPAKAKFVGVKNPMNFRLGAFATRLHDSVFV